MNKNVMFSGEYPNSEKSKLPFTRLDVASFPANNLSMFLSEEYSEVASYPKKYEYPYDCVDGVDLDRSVYFLRLWAQHLSDRMSVKNDRQRVWCRLSG